MGILSQSHGIFATVSSLQKASPVIVHLAMIFGVGIYALFGALVMQRLETKSVQRPRRASLNDNLETGIVDGVDAILANSSLSSSEINMINDSTIDINISHPIKHRHTREVAQFVRSRKCVMRALKKLVVDYDCDSKILDRTVVRMIEHCYHATIRNERSLDGVVFKSTSNGLELANESPAYVEPWSFSDSILFSFTIITTIGYGNIAPQSFGGRLFCIIYGFIGIPFTLLAIADLGKFFSEMIEAWEQRIMRLARKIKRKYRRIYRRGDMAFSMTSINFSTKDLSKAEKGDINSADKQKSAEEGGRQNDKSDDEEEELEPLSHTLPLMGIFIVYSLLGALLLSCYEPEMNFFKAIYFNFITLTSIGLGDVIPKSEAFLWLTLIYIAIGLALTTIAIDLAADYLKRLHYYGRKIENVGNVVIWFGGKTLTVKALVKNLGDQFNLPTTTMKDLNLDKFVDQAIKVEEGELETLRPPPIEPSDVMMESPVTFADDDEEWFPMRTLTPTPTPSPEPLRDPTPSPSPEPVQEEPIEEEPVVEETLPLRSPTPPPKEMTAEELAAMKRRNYSEEAWRRYQEYQKQWRRFRQTQQQYPGPQKEGRRRSSAASNSRYSHHHLMSQNSTTSQNPGSIDSTNEPNTSTNNNPAQ